MSKTNSSQSFFARASPLCVALPDPRWRVLVQRADPHPLPVLLPSSPPRYYYYLGFVEPAYNLCLALYAILAPTRLYDNYLDFRWVVKLGEHGGGLRGNWAASSVGQRTFLPLFFTLTWERLTFSYRRLGQICSRSP